MSQLVLLNVKFPLGPSIVIFIASISFTVAPREVLSYGTSSVGAKHRLTNPGKFSLELIEVQSGSYLGEDDIVRFEDVYGRSND